VPRDKIPVKSRAGWDRPFPVISTLTFIRYPGGVRKKACTPARRVSLTVKTSGPDTVVNGRFNAMIRVKTEPGTGGIFA